MCTHLSIKNIYILGELKVLSHWITKQWVHVCTHKKYNKYIASPENECVGVCTLMLSLPVYQVWLD